MYVPRFFGLEIGEERIAKPNQDKKMIINIIEDRYQKDI